MGRTAVGMEGGPQSVPLGDPHPFCTAPLLPLLVGCTVPAVLCGVL